MSEEGAVETVPRMAEGSLKRRTILGAIWSMTGHGVGNLLRMAASLVITRLLFPEAMGIMTAVNAFLVGIQMLSDLGVLQAVVRSRRGDEPDFLNTAWTLNIVRGGILYVFALALTWPMSLFYHEPQLLGILPVSSLLVIIYAFRSPAFWTAERHLAIRKLVIMEFFVYLVQIATTITLAAIYRSVWALVLGRLASALVHVVLTYIFLKSHRPRLRWDSAAWREILDFGKWIFLSSGLTFVAGYLDRMLLGHLVGMALLGIYGLARNLSILFESVVDRLSEDIIFPALSEVVRKSRERLRSIYYRARLMLDLMFLPASGVLVMVGGGLVRLMYDDRYHAAGWMFQLLIVRAAIGTILAPCQACLVSLGNSRVVFLRSLVRGISMATIVPLGWYLAGTRGLCIGVVVSEVPALAVLWLSLHRYRLLDLRREAVAAALFALGLGAGKLLVLLLAWIGNVAL
jgi:O-antigen/teichoic acid export membrane protein